MAWQYPKGAYKAYVPRGRGWKTMGQAIGGGLQNFSAQLMAIKQYEAEKEEKRRQEQYRQQMLDLQKQQFQFQQDKFAQQQTIDVAHQDMMAQYYDTRTRLLEAQISEIANEMSKQKMELPKGLDKTLAIGLPVKSALGNQLVSTINRAATAGFMNKDWSTFDELEGRLTDPALLTAEGSRVDAFGFPVTTTEMTSDMARIGTMYNQLAMMSNEYREQAKEFKEIEMPKAQSVQIRNDPKYREARAKAYRLLVDYKRTQDEKKRDEADDIMAPFNPTREEMEDLLRKAGLLK